VVELRAAAFGKAEIPRKQFPRIILAASS